MDSFTKNHPQHTEHKPSSRPRTPVALVKAAAVLDAGRSEIVDFDAFLSEESRSRYPSPLKDLAMRCVSCSDIDPEDLLLKSCPFLPGTSACPA